MVSIFTFYVDFVLIINLHNYFIRVFRSFYLLLLRINFPFLFFSEGFSSNEFTFRRKGAGDDAVEIINLSYSP